MLRLISAALWSLSITAAGLGQLAEDPWVARIPAAEAHPCLLFSADDLPRIRARLERAPYANWWHSIQASGGPVEQAFTWRMTGRAEPAEAARQMLLRSNPTGYHCCCGVADALQSYAETYDLLYGYEGLTETDHRVIRAKMARACERLYLSALESGPGQHPGNQRTRGICALGTAAIVLRGYTDAAHTPAEWLQRALDGIRDEANLCFWREDGMFIEGPDYSAFTLAVMMPFARYFERASGQWLFDDPRLANALRYLVYIAQPDGSCAALGTTNTSMVLGALTLAIGAGSREEQARIRWALEEWYGGLSGGVRELCLVDETVAPSIAGLATAKAFRTSQEVTARSEWSRGAVALWFKGKDPWIAGGYPVYSHADAGSFALHAYGELLAVDAGYDHWVSYDLYPPELHNTLLVDGAGPASETPGLLTMALTEGPIRGGEIESEFAGVRHRRSMWLVDGEYVVAFDDVTSEVEHTYEWQIHSPVTRGGAPVALGQGRASWPGFDPVADTPGRVQLDVIWAGPVELARMEHSRWQPFSPDPTTGSYDNEAIVARLRGRDASYLAVLYPHPKASEPPAIGALDVPGGRAIVVSASEGRDVVLSSEGGLVAVEGVATDARGCVVRQRDGEAAFAGLVGPGEVSLGGARVLRIDGPAPCAAAVEYCPGGVCRIAASAARGCRLSVAAPPEAEAARMVEPGGGLEPIPVDRQDGWVSFEIPDRAGRETVVLLAPADEPPVAPAPAVSLTGLAIDGHEAALGEHLDLGRTVPTPRSVLARFGASASLVAGGARVTLDGVRLPGESVRVQLVEGGRQLLADVTVPTQLPPGGHELVVRATGGALSPSAAQLNLRFSNRPLPSNAGFEEGVREWSVGSWSGDDSASYRIATTGEAPHSGRRCLELRGIVGPLNVVAAQRVDLVVGRRYVLTGWYRGDVEAKASLCSQSGAGQYIWSPPIGPSAEWTTFSWEFTAENQERPLLLGLRLGSTGVACFDDLLLAEGPA